MAQVREALDMQQPEFAQALNALAEREGIGVHYDNTAISRLENGHRKLSVEDLFLIAALDPKKRGERWLAYGIAHGHPRTPINGEGRPRKRGEA